MIRELAVETGKYRQAYKLPNYGMGFERYKAVTAQLQSDERWRASLLDVGTGRGELLYAAHLLGYARVVGTEIVPELLRSCPKVVYSFAHELDFDDGAFETVTCCDVLEHVLPKLSLDSLQEICRVARRRALITISNVSHRIDPIGELHINRHAYDKWDMNIHYVFAGWKITRKRCTSISEMWDCRHE